MVGNWSVGVVGVIRQITKICSLPDFGILNLDIVIYRPPQAEAGL
jgi:hypothetical protein